MPVPPSVQGTSGSWWQNLINNPALATFAAGAAQRLLAPPAWGQTPTSQIVGGLLGGAGDVQTSRMMQAAQQAAARKEGREEREVAVKETAEGRLGREQRSVANEREQKLGYEGQRVDIARQGRQLERERIDLEREKGLEEADRWKKSYDLNRRRVEVSERQASIDQQRLNQLVRNQADQSDIDRMRARVSEGNLNVARARLAFDKTKEEQAAIERKDARDLGYIRLAYSQAAREMEALVKTEAGFDITPEDLEKRTKERVKALLQSLRGGNGKPEGEYTHSEPVKPGGKVRVKIKSSGQTGTVDAEEFDPRTMERL